MSQPPEPTETAAHADSPGGTTRSAEAGRSHEADRPGGADQPGESRAGSRRRPSRGCLLALVLLALLAADQLQPPRHQVSARVLLAGIDLYQATLSKAMPDMGVRCRFEPTCSHYGEASIRKHGAVVGSARAAWRIARCGPWTPQGTHDPP